MVLNLDRTVLFIILKSSKFFDLKTEKVRPSFKKYLIDGCNALVKS